MKPAKHVESENREEPILREITGQVVFSERKPTGYGSCLILRLDTDDRCLWWQRQKENPADINVGQKLRGFYIKSINSNEVIPLQAYELYKGERVVTRAISSNEYEFVEG